MRSIASAVRAVRFRRHCVGQSRCFVSRALADDGANERASCAASAVALALAASVAAATPVPLFCWESRRGGIQADTDGDRPAVSRAELVRSIRTGDVTGTFRLLAQATDHVDEPLTSIGQTALAVACAAGVLPLVAALLDAGADPNAQDRTGASCLSLGCAAGHAHVAERLLKGTDVDSGLRDIYGLAPIHKAVGFGQLECLRCLLQCGADPNLRTGEVTAPPEYDAAAARHEGALHIAARLLKRAQGFGSTEHQRRHQREILEVLARHGADTLMEDVDGNTPLHFCARGGDLWGLWLLLGNTADAGAAVQAVNKFGTSVLEEADVCGWDVGLLARAAVQAHGVRRRWATYWSVYDFLDREGLTGGGRGS